ncbi:MAG: response regulator receiver modulated CheB methylesterase [Proteobacteria bacterium]|nr:response regulator receiver modulated CheB methylesterase [Pseudomonadota bacterium]
MSKRIRVLVVDDSVLIRHMLTEIINRFDDLEVIGAAPDPLVAREMIRNLNPDVLTLDVEMPRMDGLDFLERLMRLRPMPVLMISTLTERGSDITLRALELGAIDFVTKPRANVCETLEEYAEEIAEKIRAAAQARLVLRTPVITTEKLSADAILPVQPPRMPGETEKIIVIGASTGGTEALKEVLMQMPASSPGILITQHMPEGFTNSFAKRLDTLCHLHVKEAEHGEPVQPGYAYIAPGGRTHLLIKRIGNKYFIELNNGQPVNRHRPAVDVLFRSAANCVGSNSIGVILTGMGKDGALGMREMHDTGAYTIAQNEETCVVYGMPKEAVLAGGVDEIRPLGQIAARIIAALDLQKQAGFRPAAGTSEPR